MSDPSRLPFSLNVKDSTGMPPHDMPIETTDAARPSEMVKQAIDVMTEAPKGFREPGVWMPVDMPSMGLAGYPAQLRVRKLSIPDLARLSAAKKLNSYPMIVSAIGATIDDMDVRLLTHGDFDFIVNWHAVNSYVKTPLIVTWRSRYGHENKHTVDKQTRKSIAITDLARVNELKDAGYDFSRVGDELWRIHMTDLGLFNKTAEQAAKELAEGKTTGTDGLSGEELDFYYSLATWVKADNPLSFIDKLNAARNMQGVEFYDGLDEWRTVANHGVKTSAKVVCAHFNPNDAIEKLTLALSMIDTSASAGDFDEDMANHSMSLLKELSSLRKLQAEGRLNEAQPVEEEIIIPLDVTNFFPVVL